MTPFEEMLSNGQFDELIHMGYSVMKTPKLCDYYRQKDGSYMVYGLHGWMYCESANEMVECIHELRSLLKNEPIIAR